MRRFLADASHELRTPLASIAGYAEYMNGGNRTIAPELAWRRVCAQSARMTGLVEDLLLLARLDEGRPLRRTEVNLATLVAEAVWDAQAAGGGHDWQLALRLDGPVTVVADPSRLHQVVANLLANARVHTPASTPRSPSSWSRRMGLPMRDSRAGRRSRHPARPAPLDLRAVHPGRRLPLPHARRGGRHGPGPGHRGGPHGGARRPDRRGERTGANRVLGDASDGRPLRRPVLPVLPATLRTLTEPQLGPCAQAPRAPIATAVRSPLQACLSRLLHSDHPAAVQRGRAPDEGNQRR